MSNTSPKPCARASASVGGSKARGSGQTQFSEGLINLRPATIADLELLRQWDEHEHVIASDPNDDWAWEVELGRFPEWREQLIAEKDGRPIGFVQIIDPKREESHYWGNVSANLRAIDIWIGREADLGKGYGTKMMKLALALGAAQHILAARRN